MLNYTLRRLAFAVPTLLVISFLIFALLDLAPNDPTGNLPMTIPPADRELIRQSLGLDQPMPIRFALWMNQFFVNEPLNMLEQWTGYQFGDGERLRVRSWATRSPVVDLIVERMPQTLWVVGMSYVVGILIALPIGVISAYKQYSWFDQAGTFISMVGFSVPTFFTGVVLIVVFSVQLGWLPSIYDTTLVVDSWGNFWLQIKQMIMPVMVLALFNAAQISRFMRASMLDNLDQDYVRTARAKGPGDHGHRARRAAGVFGRDHHRADLPGERPRAAADHRHPGGGHSACADADLHLRGADCAVQPDRRYPLWRAGPEDPRGLRLLRTRPPTRRSWRTGPCGTTSGASSATTPGRWSALASSSSSCSAC
jgi:peptide/nickel transport system permease protein